MIRIASLALVAILMIVFVPTEAFAQRVPFFAGAATGYDPEISVVNSGAILDAQPAVSDDLKYVTINARAQNSSLMALRNFSFAGGGRAPRLGLVGGAGGDGNNNDRRNILDRFGTNLIARLED